MACDSDAHSVGPYLSHSVRPCPLPCAPGVNGIAGMQPDALSSDLEPLFETIVKEVGGGD